MTPSLVLFILCMTLLAVLYIISAVFEIKHFIKMCKRAKRISKYQKPESKSITIDNMFCVCSMVTDTEDKEFNVTTGDYEVEGDNWFDNKPKF